MDAQIEGEFLGFDAGALFRLTNGDVWQQARYRYRYQYAYRPKVELRRAGPGHEMYVPVMDDAVEVTRVGIVSEGAITSPFKGFKARAQFVFSNGQVWEQAEYKYSYHYAYRPRAIVVDGLDGLVLHVDGMGSTVRVRRARLRTS